MSYCTRCGQQIPADDQFCTSCGTPVELAGQAGRGAGIPWRRPLPLVAGIMVAATGLGAGVAAVLVNPHHPQPAALVAGQTPAAPSPASTTPASLASGGTSPSPSGSGSGLASPPPGASASGSGLASPPPGASASGSALASPPPSSSGTLVSVAPGLDGNSDVPAVTTLLQNYFTAINQHDYSAYVSLLIPSVAQNESASAFNTGYSSTTDSEATLTAISPTSSGVAATVTFTSSQQPSQSPDNSGCDNWTITLYLVQGGSGYLIGTPPTSYHAAHSPC